MVIYLRIQLHFLHSPLSLYLFLYIHTSLSTTPQNIFPLIYTQHPHIYRERDKRSVLRRKIERDRERGREEVAIHIYNCCMSVSYFTHYYGGFGELANPLQWPQLRKRRRFHLPMTLRSFLAVLKLRRTGVFRRPAPPMIARLKLPPLLP